jgi:hypothetical protein
MPFMHNLFEKLDRVRVIKDRDTKEPYLIRYYLFLKDRKKFPFNITLHKILKSDDPILHDHPWPVFTIILKGGYCETTPVYAYVEEPSDCSDPRATRVVRKIVNTKSKWRGPGSIIWHKATDLHYLLLNDEQPCTTLFFMGPQKRDWGFMGKNGWTLWSDFIKR